MSGVIWPKLIGQKVLKARRPTQNTHTQPALSGKESRLALRAYPLYEWELAFDWLPDNAPPTGQARANYVPYSQDFTQWVLAHTGTGLAPTLNGSLNSILAPDGTVTADQIVFVCTTPTNSANISEVSSVVGFLPAGTYSISCWLRTLDGSTVTVLMYLSGTNTGIFTLCTVTPNWQRFSVTGSVPNGAGSCNFDLILGDGFSTSAYANIAAWGAQVEPGSFATPYILTNGAGIRQSDLKTLIGLFEGVLGQYDTFLYQDEHFNSVNACAFGSGNGSTTAFNLTVSYGPAADGGFSQYDATLGVGAGIGSLPGALPGLISQAEWVQNTIGPPIIYTARYAGQERLSTTTRTNLALQSNGFTTTWAANNITATAASAEAPDSTTTGWQISDGVATGTHSLSQNVASVAATPYTFSVWVKTAGFQYLTLTVDDTTGTNGYSATFDLVNTLVATAAFGYGNGYGIGASIREFPLTGTGAWFRITLTGLMTAAVTSRVIISMSNAAAGSAYPSYTGANHLQYLWSAQFEQSMEATALIPTTTAAANNGSGDYSLSNLITAGTSVYTFQQIQFATAPANGVTLLWTGSFFYRVRFDQDQLDPEQILSSSQAPGHGHWKLDSLKLKQVPL
jgi:hypothetical protein